MNYLNINRFYQKNKKILLKIDGLRPSKSVPRDIIKSISKFKDFYICTKNKKVTRRMVKQDICQTGDTDVVTTNIRTMTELRFLKETMPETYVLTDRFLELINSHKSISSFLLEELSAISKLDDFNMIYNGMICVLREGDMNGKILSFPDSKSKFYKIVESEDERINYCKMVNEIYGFHGRNKDPEEADYTPNANYRFITTLRAMGLVKKNANNSKIGEYSITQKGVNVLDSIDKIIE
ncbi:MAG: hypothetical protein RSD47_05265 [Romboutsia sp.]